MKHLAPVFAFLFTAAITLVIATANAQQNRAAVTSYNNTFINANGNGAITGSILNGFNTDLINSTGFLLDQNTWTQTQTYTLNPILSSCVGYPYSTGSTAVSCSLTIPGSVITGGIPASSITGSLPASQISGSLPASQISGSLPTSQISGQLPAAQVAAATKAYGVSGSNLTTTGTMSAALTTLTVANAQDFAIGQGIRINRAGANFTLNQPTGGSVTPTGTTGGTTYIYEVAALDANGGVGAAGATFQTTTGNATLSSTNFNALTWTVSSGTAPNGYAVYKNISGVYTLVGVTNNNTFKDYGFTSYTALDWIPSIAPASPQPDYLVAKITNIVGTTFTLNVAATNSVTGQLVNHDDTAALNAYFTANLDAPLSNGRYFVSSQINLPAFIQIRGTDEWQVVITSTQVTSYIFNLNYGDNLSNLTFQTPALTAAMGIFNINSINLNNILCQDGSTGGSNSYCVFSGNSATINITNMTLQGWPLITSGQTTGGAVPVIYAKGVGFNLSNVQAINNNSTPTYNGGEVWFDSCYNCTIINSNLNNASVNNSKNSYGILVSGGSQADIISGNQILGYTNEIRTDNQISGLLTVDIVANHFDFCGSSCILFQQGSWFTVTGNSFAGEHTNGITGIYWSVTAPNGPNSVTANTFDGFDGTGSYNMQMSSTQVQTVIADNTFTHTNTPGINTSGAAVVIHDNVGYNPVGVTSTTYATASTVTYTAGSSPETHYLTGGTVTAVKVPSGGNTVCSATPCTVMLGPAETMSVTYSVAPTDVKSIH